MALDPTLVVCPCKIIREDHHGLALSEPRLRQRGNTMVRYVVIGRHVMTYEPLKALFENSLRRKTAWMDLASCSEQDCYRQQQY